MCCCGGVEAGGCQELFQELTEQSTRGKQECAGHRLSPSRGAQGGCACLARARPSCATAASSRGACLGYGRGGRRGELCCSSSCLSLVCGRQMLHVSRTRRACVCVEGAFEAERQLRWVRVRAGVRGVGGGGGTRRENTRRSCCNAPSHVLCRVEKELGASSCACAAAGWPGGGGRAAGWLRAAACLHCATPRRSFQAVVCHQSARCAPGSSPAQR